MWIHCLVDPENDGDKFLMSGRSGLLQKSESLVAPVSVSLPTFFLPKTHCHLDFFRNTGIGQVKRWSKHIRALEFCHNLGNQKQSVLVLCLVSGEGKRMSITRLPGTHS
jgi:hypothetical protein